MVWPWRARSREQSSREGWEGLNLALPLSNGLFKSARETRTTFSSSQPLKQRQQNFHRQAISHSRPTMATQHLFECKRSNIERWMPGEGLLPGRWTFLSGGREAVDGQISPRLSPAQPGRGTCSQSLCQDFPLFSSSHRASLHGVSIPALFSLGLVLWWQYLGTKRIRGVPTPVPSYHILGRST